MLKDAGLIDQRDGRYELTPKGVRALGQKALGDLFRKMLRDRPGRHELERTGAGHERTYEHKPYEFGDPFHLNVEQTVRNAITRQGSGTPVRLTPDDFEVERTEVTTRSATVLMLDVSMSMPMRDNFLPAKKVAMALHALITTQFPRDYFGLVSFGRVAREVKPQLLPEMGWDFEWGTNMQHALLLARQQLERQTGTKQIIMVTDGEPTAHIERGEAIFQYPPRYTTIEQTLKEVQRCTKAGHPHQHLHARRVAVPPGLRPPHDGDEPRPRVLRRRPRPSATTCSSTSSSTARPTAAPADRLVRSRSARSPTGLDPELLASARSSLRLGPPRP